MDRRGGFLALSPFLAVSVLIAAAFISGCGLASGNSATKTTFSNGVGAVKTQQISFDGKATLQAYLAAGELSDLQYPDFTNFRTEANEFYEASGDSLPWIAERRPSAQAHGIIEELQQADNEGLNPVDYDGPRWAARLAVVDGGRAAEPELVRFDLAVTISTMRYISDLHRGRVNPREFHFDLDITNDKLDVSAFLLQKLVGAANVNEVMQTVEPPFPAYRRTVEALRTYMKLASADNGELLPAPAKPVKPGGSYASVAQLTRRLMLLGDLPPDTTAAAGADYSGPLVNGVKRFQERHGLDANGILDAHTLNELNTPLSQRVTQLKLTLERWRWLPHQFDEPPIVVNIPEFRVYAANDKYGSAFDMKVVVGRSYKHKTPVFATQMKSVIFRPYWNVPLSIQKNELLPELRKNANYLSQHDYQVVGPSEKVVSEGEVNEAIMAQLASGKMGIRQRPGPTNSLGLIKFDMPNGYDVYMHDTPAQQLFSRSRRDFSHGCIRVENPVELALWVLRDKPEWDRDHIVEAMNGDETFRVNLSKPIPVLILYGTAIDTESGEVHFFDDIYGLDSELQHRLAQGYPYNKGE
ncbi:MAG TPA: L,D-transpeptidase family protein [Candidatus Acidoferrales bacterium]|jgi:murein L,D-transpeptidase YcbB/YkuD|nr:L,D-transpeptidase family protein [Candidatus Acidoferrales bacterium]